MDDPAAPHQVRARTERVEPDGADDDARTGAPAPAPASRQAGAQVLNRSTPTSGAKGFAVILGAMLGIIGLLWLIAALVSPH